MIEQLSIKNVALIDALEIQFGAGLNILSGETGAGKSILIDAVNFAVGGRVGREFIRGGAAEAHVEALFYVADVKEELAALGVDIDEDDALMISRAMTEAGRGACRVNGKTVTLGMLKEIGALLIDIHGQHEHQSLLNPARHIGLLDRFCGDALAELMVKLSEAYRAYRDVKKQLQALQMDERERQSRVEMLTYQIEELEAARLVRGEDDELAARKRLLANAGKLAVSAGTAAELLSGGGEDGAGAADKLYEAIALLRGIARLDERVSGIADRLDEAYATVDDCARDFRKYYDKLSFDPNEIDAIEARLDVLYKLKRKYGATVADMLDFYEGAKGKLAAIESSDETAAALTKRSRALKDETEALCREATKLRQTAAGRIRAEIEGALKQLGMKDARFEIQIEQGDEPGANGWDAVEFLISANKGEAPRPLSKIASGGEMSRVMLALKATLADCDPIGTFIFDEIDAGISGRTAHMVAEKLALVAKERQVLCITHLPQIAAVGTDNFLIEKSAESGRAVTTVRKLDEDGVLKELARLIGGARVTEATIAAAKELRGQTI